MNIKIDLGPTLNTLLNLAVVAGIAIFMMQIRATGNRRRGGGKSMGIAVGLLYPFTMAPSVPLAVHETGTILFIVQARKIEATDRHSPDICFTKGSAGMIPFFHRKPNRYTCQRLPVFLATVLSLLVGMVTTQSAPAQVQLELDRDSIDFGQIKVGYTSESEFTTLYNRGSEPWEVDCSGGGGGAHILSVTACAGKTLNPGESCQHWYQFKPVVVGPVESSRVLTCGGTRFTVALRGEGTEPDPADLEFDLTSIDFGQTAIGAPGNRKARLYNRGAEATVAACTGGLPVGNFDAGTNCLGAQLQPGEFCEMTFLFLPDAEGPHDGSSTWSCNGKEFTISLHGEGLASNGHLLSLDQDSLDFGQVMIGHQESIYPVRLINQGTQPVVLDCFATASSEIVVGTSCTGVTLASGASCDWNYVFKPKTEGVFEFTSEVACNGDTHSIALRGEGISQDRPAVYGKVTDGSTGQALGGVTLTVTPHRGASASVESQASGNYAFQTLPPGVHTITFAKETADWAPQEISVPADAEGHSVDFTLWPGNQTIIHGLVISQLGGDPIAGINVVFEGTIASGDQGTESLITDQAGRFELDGLDGTEISLNVSDPNGVYLPRQVRPALMTPGMNELVIHLESGGYVSGTVTREAGGPFQGVTVYAWGEEGAANPPSWSATTAEDGTYRVGPMPTPSVKVAFMKEGFAERWWPDGYHYTMARPVELVPDLVKPRIDMVMMDTLSRPVLVQVVDERGVSVEKAWVQVLDETDPGQVLAEGETSDSGWFDVNRVPLGLRRITAEKQGYQDASITVDVTREETVPLQTLRLSHLGAPDIVGRVLDRGTRNPVEGATVQLSQRNADPSVEGHSASWITDHNGRFEFRDPGTGNFSLTADHGDYWHSTQELELDGSDDEREFEFLIGRLATVHGTVRNEAGEPLSRVDITAWNDTARGLEKNLHTGEFTGADGAYTLKVLPGEATKLEFVDITGEYMNQWYAGSRLQAARGVADAESAKPITATAFGEDIGLADVIMRRPGGTISGTVTDDSGAPLAGIEIEAYTTDTIQLDWQASAFSGQTGEYRLPLPTGDFYLRFRDPQGVYISETWENVTDLVVPMGTVIQVGGGEPAGLFDAALAIKSPGENQVTVLGQAIDEDSWAGIPGISVSFHRYHADGIWQYASTVATDQDGHYQTVLEQGEYRVFFDAGSTGYQSQWHSNAYSLQSAETLPLALDRNAFTERLHMLREGEEQIQPPDPEVVDAPVVVVNEPGEEPGAVCLPGSTAPSCGENAPLAERIGDGDAPAGPAPPRGEDLPGRTPPESEPAKDDEAALEFPPLIEPPEEPDPVASGDDESEVAPDCTATSREEACRPGVDASSGAAAASPGDSAPAPPGSPAPGSPENIPGPPPAAPPGTPSDPGDDPGPDSPPGEPSPPPGAAPKTPPASPGILDMPGEDEDPGPEPDKEPLSDPPPPGLDFGIDPGGLGSAYGEVHMQTLDGAAYDLQAAGEFILARDETGEFEVQIRTAPWGSRNDISITTGAAARVHGDVVNFTHGGSSEVHVNGAPTEFGDGETLHLDGGGSVAKTRLGYRVSWPDGTTFDVDRTLENYDTHLATSPERSGTLSGLLGNANGDPSDDFVTRNGELLKPPLSFEVLYPVFADSWRFRAEESLLHYEEGESSEGFNLMWFPARAATLDAMQAQDRNRAEQVCKEAGLADKIAFEACVVDVGFTGLADFAQGTLRMQARNKTAGIVPQMLADLFGAPLASFDAPEQVATFASFEVTWYGPNKRGDFIEMVPTFLSKEEEQRRFVQLAVDTHATALGNPATMTVHWEPGPYELRYRSSASGEWRTLGTRKLTVVAGIEPSLEAAPGASAGAAFPVQWVGPNRPGDVIALVREGEPDDTVNVLDSKRTIAGNPLLLKAPVEPGRYELRYIYGQARPAKVLARAAIQVD